MSEAHCEPVCRRCEHGTSKHCKGHQEHTDHKEDSRMVERKWRRGNNVCKTRHCLNPLCSCVDFIEPEKEAA